MLPETPLEIPFSVIGPLSPQRKGTCHGGFRNNLQDHRRLLGKALEEEGAAI
jgi:hypothetical protein